MTLGLFVCRCSFFNSYYHSYANDVWALSSQCENEQISVGRSYQGSSIDVSNCVFSRSSLFSGSGGVIYASGGTYTIIISNSIFYNSSCNDRGGAIYSDSSSSSIRMTCVHSCSALNEHFAYLQANQHLLEYISIGYCSPKASGNYPFQMYKGSQRADYINSSMNQAESCSGFYTAVPSSFSSSFCTFSNNNVSNSCCLEFAYNSGSMIFANIVHNNSPQRGIIVDFMGSYNLNYCVFYSNQDTLFCLNSGSLTLSHCFISHASTFSTSSSVATSNNNSFSKMQTYSQSYYYTGFCLIDHILSPTQKHYSYNRESILILVLSAFLE